MSTWPRSRSRGGAVRQVDRWPEVSVKPSVCRSSFLCLDKTHSADECHELWEGLSSTDAGLEALQTEHSLLKQEYQRLLGKAFLDLHHTQCRITCSMSKATHSRHIRPLLYPTCLGYLFGSVT